MVRMLEKIGNGNYAGEDNYIVQSGEAEGVDAEVALWRAVITQALMDAGSRSAKQEVRLSQAQAVAWLSGMSDDFVEVCGRAELDPDYVRDKAREAIRRGCAWRQDACQSIRRNKRKKLKEMLAINPICATGEIKQLKVVTYKSCGGR